MNGKDDEGKDDLNACRGILLGLVLGSLCWLLMIFLFVVAKGG